MFIINSGLISRILILIFFFFNDTATTEIYTLSLHDALPISHCSSCCATRALVRCSSKPSSGCLWMSRRTSTKAAAEPRKVSRRVFMCGISLGLQADGAGNAAVAGGLGLIELRGFGQRHGRSE